MATPTSPDRASILPEVLSFFRDIKAHPDDDTPRLIFADWLQEYGDAAAAARGEYLRLRVLRDRLSPDDPSYDVLKRREAELFTKHRWTWLGPLCDAAKRWTFERGMLQISAEVENILTPEVTVWSRTEPALWIDALALTTINYTAMDYLPQSPLIAHIVRLDLSGNPIRTVLRALFPLLRSKILRHLTQLLLCRNQLTAVQIAPLARSRHCRRLSLLDLQHNQLDDAAARLLAKSPFLTNGTTLRLGHNRFTAEGIALLREAFGERVCF